MDFVLNSPRPEVSIGIEIERVKIGKKKRKAEPFIHGLGQAMLALTRRDWAVLVVYWPPTGPADRARQQRKSLRNSLEGLVRDGRLRVVILPAI